MDINSLFFELIQVSLGTRICLSHTPSADEWGELYAMAKKQSLVGVCFAAVQRLYGVEDSINHKPYTINLPEIDYLRWMGMAAKIQQRNEEVNKACDEICERVRADGFECCVLKGQSNREYYPDSLRCLRTPGDIDLWVWKSSEDGKHRIAEVVRYAKLLNPDAHPYYHHADINKVMGVDAELHYRPSWMSAPWRNRYLQRWVQCHAPSMENVASVEFNAVYQLVHIYRHLFSEGVGLRQLLDYYFVLREVQRKGFKVSKVCASHPCAGASLRDSLSVATGLKPSSDSLSSRDWPSVSSEFQVQLKRLGMKEFAGAVMYVLVKVFANDDDNDTLRYDNWASRWSWMICEPDVERGEFLLSEIMMAGNFGQYDERIYTTKADGAFGWGWMKLKRNMRFLTQYPEEVLCEPWFRVYHWMWRSFKLWRNE